MSDSKKSNIVQELTSFLAILLPIVQVAFIYLPDSLKGLFVQQDNFLSVSLVTLLISYVSIVAYKARPGFVLVLPIHKKRMKKYQDWRGEIYQTTNEISQLANDYGQQMLVKKLRLKLEKLNTKKVGQPYKIDYENRIGVLVTVLFLNTFLFLTIGLAQAEGFWSTLQSLNYLLIIVISALVLVIYRDSSDSNKRYAEDLRLSSDKAIQLAINARCFGSPPQVKFVSTHGGIGLDNNLVRVEFNGDQYEISTNNNATKLIYCFKLPDESK